MSKNKFGIPGIVFEANPSPTGVIGGGTVQAGQGNNDLPMTFEAWSQNAELVSFYDSLGDGMNDPDWEEYGMWWADCDYSFAQWEALGYTQQQWNDFVAPNLW